jgi:hypothetical protein
MWKLNKIKYHLQISNRFVPLENFLGNWDISEIWENIRKNTKISVKENLSYYKLQEHKLCFD